MLFLKNIILAQHVSNKGKWYHKTGEQDSQCKWKIVRGGSNKNRWKTPEGKKVSLAHVQSWTWWYTLISRHITRDTDLFNGCGRICTKQRLIFSLLKIRVIIDYLHFKILMRRVTYALLSSTFKDRWS